MSNVFRFREGQPVTWFNRNASESNQFCLYCGRRVGSNAEIESNKEHLIGRNFVPKGSLAGDAFNFVFRACIECNTEKSDAERHVSTVSLFNSPARLVDLSINDLAARKASNDHHPTERRLVRDASVPHKIETEGNGFSGTLHMTSPPQLEYKSVLLLAVRQIQGLFALISTEDPRVPEKSKLLAADKVLLHKDYNYGDWGNPQLIEIIERTKGWSAPLFVNSASGHFKAILRIPKSQEEGYFWALEWNKSVRIVGAICHPSQYPVWLKDLPQLKWWSIPGKDCRIRMETPLRGIPDHLFTTE